MTSNPEISEGIQIVGLFLYIPKHKTLVVGDTHLGYEESLTSKGILLPKFQYDEIKERTKKALTETKPDKVILVGDIKHDFGRISREEWRDVLDYIDLLKEHAEPILIRGNHDTMLEPLARKKDLELYETYRLDKILFCHGHELPELGDEETIIMGHEHPSLGLREGSRVELYKCFLKGKYKDKELIILPSVSSMPEGSNVLREKLQSPLIDNIDDFEAYVVQDGEVYDFGKIGNL